MISKIKHISIKHIGVFIPYMFEFLKSSLHEITFKKTNTFYYPHKTILCTLYKFWDSVV